MTVHTQRVEVRHPTMVAPGQRLLAWFAIAAVLALIAIAMLALFEVIGPPTQGVPMIERLQELRTSIGGGGFI